MTHHSLLFLGILGSAVSSACGGSVVAGSGGGGTTSGGGGSATTSITTTGAGGTTSITTTGAGGAGGGIVSCSDAPMDPNACPAGQKCQCGGPGGQLLCECGLLCASDADCTNPQQPLCCGGGKGTPGACTTTCLCLCD